MIKRSGPYIIFLFSALFFFLITDLYATGKVTASGSSFFEPGREMIAREKALDEAKRAAIEKAMGVSIESKSLMVNYEIIKDQIVSRSSGYLKNIKIIDEKKTALETYDVTIEADVEYAALVDDFDRFNKSVNWQKNPRVSIFIEACEDDNIPIAQKIVNILGNRLKNDGLKVYKYSEDIQTKMGLVLGLTLDSNSIKSTYQDVELKLNEISLSANIYLPGNNEILASTSATKSIPGENQITALDKGARQCIDAIWKNLRRKLIKQWETELYNERNISLLLKNVPSYSRAQNIGNIFKSDVLGVIDVSLLNYFDGAAEYMVIYRGWPEQFFDEIQLSYFKNKYFDTELEVIATNQLIIVLSTP
jgi:hypothetical protein